MTILSTPELDNHEDWLDHCYENNLDPEEEEFYELADIQHDLSREDEDSQSHLTQQEKHDTREADFIREIYNEHY